MEGLARLLLRIIQTRLREGRERVRVRQQRARVTREGRERVMVRQERARVTREGCREDMAGAGLYEVFGKGRDKVLMTAVAEEERR